MHKVRCKMRQKELESQSCHGRTSGEPAGFALFIGAWNVAALLVINHRQHSFTASYASKYKHSAIRGIAVFDSLGPRFVLGK